MDIGDAGSELEELTIISSPLLTGIASLPSSLLRINVMSVSTILSWEPFTAGCVLESLKMSGTANSLFPAGLDNCENLYELSFVGLTETRLDALIPYNWSATSLTAFTIKYQSTWPSSLNLVSAQQMLCTIPAGLVSLDLSNTRFRQLPSCMGQFDRLIFLELQDITFPADIFHLADVSSSLESLGTHPSAINLSPTVMSGWAQTVQKFPSLTRLLINTPIALDHPFPVNELRQLQYLERLSIPSAGFTGELPEDLFESWPDLQSLDLANNELNGTIPTSGWNKLQFVNLAYNRFTEWPYMHAPSAPELQYINLRENPLQSLPNDASFLEMTSLRHLDVAGLQQMQGPLPVFWASGQHKLHGLDSQDSQFRGSLPAEIRSPYIRILDISRNNLCGELPEIPSPVGLFSLVIPFSGITGSIPASWGSKLTITSTLDLSGNFLTGPVPANLTTPYGEPKMYSIDLSDNYLTGPLPNMSRYSALSLLELSGQNMSIDACSNDPELGVVSICPLRLHPSICRCQSYYLGCLPELDTYCTDTGSPSAPSAPIVPPQVVNPPTFGACITPAPLGPSSPTSPPPPPVFVPPSCPLPGPGPSFSCVDGVWKSTESVTQPSLIVPGTTQPGKVTTIIVEGNLTVTGGGVVFNGFESQIIVNGCIFLGDNQVTIELTKEELEQLANEGKLSKTLISSLTENNCIGSSDLSGTRVSVNKGSGSKSCRKVTAKNAGSTQSSLQVVFAVDNSVCNMIIIIPSVIGGVLVITAIALAVGLQMRRKLMMTRISAR
jgi:hypothetical protein